MRKYVAIAFLLAAPLAAHGQNANSNPDFQLRIPVHIQRGNWAGWIILPNVTAPDNNAAVLAVAGRLFRYGENGRGGWTEVMGGTRLNQDGYVDPLINLRLSEGRVPRVSIFADIQFFPGRRGGAFTG
jgi:hypothetical protein